MNGINLSNVIQRTTTNLCVMKNKLAGLIFLSSLTDSRLSPEEVREMLKQTQTGSGLTLFLVLPLNLFDLKKPSEKQNT